MGQFVIHFRKTRNVRDNNVPQPSDGNPDWHTPLTRSRAGQYSFQSETRDSLLTVNHKARAEVVSSTLLSRKSLSDEAVQEALALTQKTDSSSYCIWVTKQYCEEARQSIKRLPNDLVVLSNQLDSVAELISSFEK